MNQAECRIVEFEDIKDAKSFCPPQCIGVIRIPAWVHQNYSCARIGTSLSKMISFWLKWHKLKFFPLRNWLIWTNLSPNDLNLLFLDLIWMQIMHIKINIDIYLSIKTDIHLYANAHVCSLSLSLSLSHTHTHTHTHTRTHARIYVLWLSKHLTPYWRAYLWKCCRQLLLCFSCRVNVIAMLWQSGGIIGHQKFQSLCISF